MNYAEWDKLIIELRAIRPDLSVETIKTKLQKLAVQSRDSVETWTLGCLAGAKKGRPMPWELENENREHKIILYEGKYTIIFNPDPKNYVFKALRHGEEWQNLVGNGLMLALVQEHLELRGDIDYS